jgi:hypothetical protein
MPRAAASLAAAATALALASVWHSGSDVWGELGRQYRTFAPLSTGERRQVALQQIGVPGAVFDFYAAYIVPGDRVYFQVRPGGRGSAPDLPAAFEAAGRFYLLPAVQADTLADATVVVSYLEDPSRLHIAFVTQKQDGRRPIYISRISSP